MDIIRKVKRGLILLLVRVAAIVPLLWLAACQSQPEPPQRRLNGVELKLVWSYESGAPINQVPARTAGVVVVAPNEGALIALDSQSGALRWQYDPPEGVWERSFVADRGRIYLGVGGGSVVALDADTGELIWEQQVGIEVQRPSLVVGDRLFVPTTFVGPRIQSNHDGRATLNVLDVDTGEELWSVETENYILQTPTMHGGRLYLAGAYQGQQPVEEGGHMRLYALDASNGKVQWTYESEDGFPKRLHASDSTVAFIGYQDFASGIDAESGKLRWRRTTGNWVPSLTGADDRIFFGSANTVVHALRLDDGEVLWQHNIEQGTFNYVLGAPILIEDELYFLTQHGDLMGLSAITGELLWTVPTRITSRVGMELSDGWIYIGGEDGVIYAFNDQ